MPTNNYIDIMEKNHMEIPWHDYTGDDSNTLIKESGLIEKASVIGRVGLIMLSCGTGAWRVRTSMNRLSKELHVTCTVDVGLMSIEFNCFDGKDCVSQSLSIANTGVNTSKLYRMEQFVDNFPKEDAHLTGEEIHKRLDAFCVYCSRCWKYCPYKAYKTSFYIIFKYSSINFNRMFGLCHLF